MHARIVLTSSLTVLCMIGAGKILKPRGISQHIPPASHIGRDHVIGQRGSVTLTTQLVVNGLSRPLQVVAPPNDFDRIFIVEQRSGSTGRIRVFNLKTNTLNSTPFLSVNVSTASEQGLLGLTFHPNYAVNGYFYINYTNSTGSTVIERYTVSANPDVADANSGTVIMTYAQPFENHNGGWIDFGPDGFLYIATGDGGSGGDPGNRSQDITNQRLGKMLRIDVDGGKPYSVPPDNPFVGITGDDEIWAYGLRNPWRCTFDRATGDLWMGDVGQNMYEEISFQPASSVGGENYGWRCYEGNHAFNTTGCPPSNTMVFPIWEYDHFSGCSLTGGDVYRGSAIPGLQGTYFFADYCFGTIWSLRYDGTAVFDFQDRTAELDPPGSLAINLISSFGQDAAGEMYICDLTGEVFKIVPLTPNGACCNGSNGSCVDLPESSCIAGGGTWLGAGTLCADGGCDQITCPEDINGDGNIDTIDLLAVIGNWGACTGCQADINGDGSVDTTDLLAIIGNWGVCP